MIRRVGAGRGHHSVVTEVPEQVAQVQPVAPQTLVGLSRGVVENDGGWRESPFRSSTATPCSPPWKVHMRAIEVGASAPETYLRLRGQRPDLPCGQPGGRRCEPKPDHPDRPRDPEDLFQQLHREVTFIALRDPEDRSQLGPIDASLGHGLDPTPPGAPHTGPATQEGCRGLEITRLSVSRSVTGHVVSLAGDTVRSQALDFLVDHRGIASGRRERQGGRDSGRGLRTRTPRGNLRASRAEERA